MDCKGWDPCNGIPYGRRQHPSGRGRDGLDGPGGGPWGRRCARRATPEASGGCGGRGGGIGDHPQVMVPKAKAAGKVRKNGRGARGGPVGVFVTQGGPHVDPAPSQQPHGLTAGVAA